MQLMFEGRTETDAGEGPPQARSRRPVDLVHLARYTLGNRSLEREVLELFCTQSILYLRRLETASCDKGWRDAAHTIKGSARSIGAWRVAHTAEAAEALQGKALQHGRDEALRLLTAAVAEASAYIRGLLVEQ